jgi:hypothetical protein
MVDGLVDGLKNINEGFVGYTSYQNQKYDLILSKVILL